MTNPPGTTRTVVIESTGPDPAVVDRLGAGAGGTLARSRADELGSRPAPTGAPS